ncbi:protein mono-ADP-ribosyltransferase PARP14-like isoform X1 [Mytilus californianus]|uniref:protein mono-ADP-ribosyltransferase PARP14-like isoform X1 n=1 Tax=Mytilus californianus TaxID=6549 RepID=UPI002245D13C|nr:protein mono-ADP-ribosyltransferase PARP14-like isoform X1 [Mytilus californianus]
MNRINCIRIGGSTPTRDLFADMNGRRPVNNGMWGNNMDHMDIRIARLLAQQNSPIGFDDDSSDSDDSEDNFQTDLAPMFIGGARGGMRPQRNPQTTKQTQKAVPTKRKNFDVSIDIGNISLKVKSGNLAEQEADVIVNSVATDLDLTKGVGSSAIFAVGGQVIQQECDDNYSDGISFGDVAITSGGQLKCSKIYHVALPSWNNNEQEIQAILKKCFVLMGQSHVALRSVVIPPLGHGFLGFPDDVIARNMISTIVEFGKNPQIHHASVSIVCHRRQHVIFKALKTEVKRLTVQLHMDMYKGDLKTPSYWTKYDQTKTLREWNCHQISAKCWEQVQVSPEERSAIEKLVMDTWMKQFVGHGRDSRGLNALNYANIQILDVERIENPLLAERYFQCRATMFHKVGQLERTFTRLKDIPYAKNGGILTTKKAGKTLTREMCQMVNEHYLFHGTTVGRIDVIAAQGFDNRLTENAMFGPGVYAAESSTKSDQYADPRDQRDKRSPKKMILTRMLLGEIYVTDQPKSFQRPPCKTCKKDKCCDSSHNPRGQGFFDSVVVDGQWNFREFIVYNSSQCYPEYIITYKRK